MLLVPTYVAPSKIHGVGVFAAESIPAGALMWRFEPGIDLIISPEHAETLPQVFRDFLEVYAYISDQFPGGYVLSCDHARFLNHSSDPNTDNSSLVALARREIAAGEEITCDYGEFCVSYEL